MRIPNKGIGRFFIDSKLIRNHCWMAEKILEGIVVVDARYDVSMERIEYLGFSEKFEEVPPHIQVPFYVSILNGSEKNKIKFVKI